MTLSPAHCFAKEDFYYVPEKYIQLYFGASDLYQITGGIPYDVYKIQKRTIKSVFTHQDYSHPYAKCDIAIIGIAF